MNHNIYTTKINDAFIRKINILVILSYGWMLLYEFGRYYDSSYAMLFLKLTLAIKILLLCICITKAVYYYNDDPKYSLTAMVSIALLFLYYCVKFHGDYQQFLFQRPYYLILALLIFATYKISFRCILSTYLITTGIPLFLRIIFSFAYLLPSDTHIPNGWGSYWDFGFSHRNSVFHFLVFIILAWLYLVKECRFKYMHVIPMVWLAQFLYRFTHTKTGIALILLCVVCVILLCISNHHSENSIFKIYLYLFKKIMFLMPSLLLIISFIGTLIYNYYCYKTHSDITTGSLFTFIQRFRLFSFDCALNGISLPWSNDMLLARSRSLSHNYSWIIGNISYTTSSDNIIHYILINNGIIILTLFIVLLQLWAIYAYKKSDYYSLLIIGMISIYGLMENAAIQYVCNPFLLLPLTINSNSYVDNNDLYPLHNKISKMHSIVSIIASSIIIILGYRIAQIIDPSRSLFYIYIGALTLIYTYIMIYLCTRYGYKSIIIPNVVTLLIVITCAILCFNDFDRRGLYLYISIIIVVYNYLAMYYKCSSLEFTHK